MKRPNLSVFDISEKVLCRMYIKLNVIKQMFLPVVAAWAGILHVYTFFECHSVPA